MYEQVSRQSRQVWFSLRVEKLIEADREIFMDRIEDAANGQERDRTGRGRRRDGGALHVNGQSTGSRRQDPFLLHRQNVVDGEDWTETVPTIPSSNYGYGCLLQADITRKVL